MSDRYYLTAGAHTTITGATGAGEGFGGKSVLANWWVTNAVEKGWYGCGIFFNPKGHRFPHGQTVHTLKGFAESYRAGYRVFNYIPRRDTTKAHDGLMRTLRAMPGTKILAHDEAHEYSESEMLDWCLRQGGNVQDSEKFVTGDMVSLVVSQHPWDLPESASNNTPLKIWVGPTTPEAERYFQSMGIQGAYGHVKEHAGKYRWSVIDGGEYVETNPPVPGKYA